MCSVHKSYRTRCSVMCELLPELCCSCQTEWRGKKCFSLWKWKTAAKKTSNRHFSLYSKIEMKESEKNEINQIDLKMCEATAEKSYQKRNGLFVFSLFSCFFIANTWYFFTGIAIGFFPLLNETFVSFLVNFSHFFLFLVILFEMNWWMAAFHHPYGIRISFFSHLLHKFCNHFVILILKSQMLNY